MHNIACTIHGLREHSLIVKPAGTAGFVTVALVGPAGRYGEAITLPEGSCEQLAQALALSLYGGSRRAS